MTIVFGGPKHYWEITCLADDEGIVRSASNVTKTQCPVLSLAPGRTSGTELSMYIYPMSYREPDLSAGQAPSPFPVSVIRVRGHSGVKVVDTYRPTKPVQEWKLRRNSLFDCVMTCDPIRCKYLPACSKAARPVIRNVVISLLSECLPFWVNASTAKAECHRQDSFFVS